MGVRPSERTTSRRASGNLGRRCLHRGLAGGYRFRVFAENVPRKLRLSVASRRAVVVAAILVFVGVAGGPRSIAAPPTDADAKKLVEAVFALSGDARWKALETLAPVDVLTPAEAEVWRAPLLALAAKRPKGSKPPKKGKNFLYDKPDRGLFLVGGVDGGKGGLLIALHGGGVGAGDAASAFSAFGGAASERKALLASPEVIEKTERGWTDPPETEKFVMEMIETLIRSEKVDRNHVVLTGHSMGGYGTWTIGSVHADWFAGLAAFAGAPTCARERAGGPITGVDPGVMPNLRDLPISVYQSMDDQNVPAESNEFATKELDRLAKEDPGGYEHRYERVDGRGHAFPADGPGPGIAWASKKPRDPRPKKVVWQPSRAWVRQFYWLTYEGPLPGPVVTVESKGDNRFDVTASDSTEGLRLLVDARTIDFSKDVVVMLAGKEVFRGPARPSLQTMVSCLVDRADPELLFVASVPAFWERR
jgi:dienelactone hydrolase